MLITVTGRCSYKYSRVRLREDLLHFHAREPDYEAALQSETPMYLHFPQLAKLASQRSIVKLQKNTVL